MKTATVNALVAWGLLLQPVARAEEVRTVQPAPPPIISVADPSIEGQWRAQRDPNAFLEITKQGQDYLVRVPGFFAGVYAGRLQGNRIFLGAPLGYLTIIGNTIYLAGEQFVRAAPPPGPTMTIEHADYGSADHICDATGEVANLCNDLQECEIIPTNELCGDPDAGHEKQLAVRYTCNGIAHGHVANENQHTHLSCRANWDIIHR